MPALLTVYIKCQLNIFVCQFGQLPFRKLPKAVGWKTFTCEQCYQM